MAPLAAFRLHHQLHCQPGCPPVSHLTTDRRPRFFGHLARADPKQDHHRFIGTSLRPPSHWRRPCGHPRTLRTTDTGVQSANIGIHSAWRKASDRTLWRRIVDAATLHHDEEAAIPTFASLLCATFSSFALLVASSTSRYFVAVVVTQF